MPMAKIRINNVVASVTYDGTKFDLEKLTRILDGARYDPDIFPGAVYKAEDPHASGKMSGS